MPTDSISVVSDRARQRAELHVDGTCVATARGAQMPERVGGQLWLGSLRGRSQMLGELDDVTIAPAQGDG